MRPVESETAGQPAGRTAERRLAGLPMHRTALVLTLILPLVLLNAALTFDNLWPTPAIVPSIAISLEFLALTGVLIAAAPLAPHRRRRVVTVVAVFFTVLVLGRYAEVTLPALFGRPINLYWDGRHIPSLLVLAWQQTPWWQSVAVVCGIGLLVVIVHRILHAAARRFTETVAGARPATRRHLSFAALAGTAASLAALLIPAVGAVPIGPQTHLRDYIVQPVSATLMRQTQFVATALSPGAAARILPPGPAFGGNVQALGGADLILVFLESYGAAAFDNPTYARHLQPHRDALTDALDKGGRHAVSAFVRSPTFGGGSWLAHASLLSGIDVSDPGHYDLLLTTRRPTLVSHFSAHGYGTVALMPGIRTDWPEGSFYGYDTLLDSRNIAYQGPDFGFWRIPDQVSLAKFAAQRREAADPQPQFVVFPTVSSHLPFGPVPPYQPDWSRLAAATPFPSEEVTRSLSGQPDWLDLGPAYARTLAYSFDWITGFIDLPSPRSYLMILIGDHQPAASVSGRDASWEVPVHLITSDARLAQRFQERGFLPGLLPQRPALGAMSELTGLLLDVLNIP